MQLQPTLTFEKIIIRPLQESDFSELYKIASDKLLWEQHPNKDRYKKEVFEAFFRKALESKSAFVFLYSNIICGSSRYYDYDTINSTIAIGFTFIDRKYWGTNLNKNIKKLMLDYAFQFVTSIVFHVGETNFRSQKAVEKLKANKISIIKTSEGKIDWLYELNKENWQKSL